MPSIIILLTFLLVSAELTFAKVDPPLKRLNKQDEKLLLRTKRQHCTCLNVRVSTDNGPVLGPGLDSLDSTYRCTCNSAGNPAQQQRELQQILQQVEPFSSCSCSPGGLTGIPPTSPDSPLFGLQQSQQQWDCTCIGNGQPPRPTPPQFFPWNKPVGPLNEYVPISGYGPRFQNRQTILPSQQYEPTTLPPPSPSLSTPQFLDNTTPLHMSFNDFSPINEQRYTPYPIQQSQIAAFRFPERNGVFETFPGPPVNGPKCPCMEVVISVIRTDANGNRYPAAQPLCICAPTANPNMPVTVRPVPAPLPLANNDPVRQPLVPPQPQFQPPPPLVSPPQLQFQPSPPQTPSPLIPTVTSNPSILSSPAPLPIVNTPAGTGYYDTTRQPFIPPYPPSSSSYYNPAAYALADEPAIMPCVMTITIGGLGTQQCKCQENYHQCSATHCCNHKAYRSLKADPTTSTPSAVDLLLEFAERFKKHLEAQQSK